MHEDQRGVPGLRAAGHAVRGAAPLPGSPKYWAGVLPGPLGVPRGSTRSQQNLYCQTRGCPRTLVHTAFPLSQPILTGTAGGVAGAGGDTGLVVPPWDTVTSFCHVAQSHQSQQKRTPPDPRWSRSSCGDEEGELCGTSCEHREASLLRVPGLGGPTSCSPAEPVTLLCKKPLSWSGGTLESPSGSSTS